MQLFHFSENRTRAMLRILLSHYVANGFSAALGLLLITGGIHIFIGQAAAAAASVGVIVCIPPDQPAPKRGKFLQLLPAALIGLPLFFAVQVLHSSPLYLGLLLVPGTFVAFLGAAWGKRGLPISVSIMFAMIFSMAAPHTNNADGTAIASSMHFALGAGLYLLYATAASALLNARYRVQILADTLLSLADLLRTQAQQFIPANTLEKFHTDKLLANILQQQSTLADQLQTARDIVLEAPRTATRQKLAAMLMQVLEMRDHLLMCELDLEILKAHDGHAQLLMLLGNTLEALAKDMEYLADSFLVNRTPLPVADRREILSGLQWNHQPTESIPSSQQLMLLGRSLTGRIAFINDEALRLVSLARGDAKPDLAVIRAAWQMFVSPNSWSWKPLTTLGGWDAPPLRHAIRAALAIGTAYALSLAWCFAAALRKHWSGGITEY